MQRAFRNGVHLVDLAGLTDASLLPQTIATSLGLRDDSPRPPIERLVESFADGQLLIILDNCEHMLDESAQIVDTLLTSCPELRVLVTSRSALRIDGECTMPVPPLSVPEEGADLEPEELLRSESARLFAARATASLPSFEVTSQNAKTVAELCRRLDGVPLAIELAAVRMRALSVDQILTGLSDRYHLLTQGSRAALPRQQTLRSLMDWSYDLLSAGAQLLWARTSAFADSFELDAAEGICSDDQIRSGHVLDLLSELVDKSVLLREDQGTRVRYRLLETVREYGLQRLQDSGEQDTVRRRHRDWYSRFTSLAREGLGDGSQVEWYLRLRAEHSNLRLALDYCNRTAQDALIGLRMAADLQHYWVMTGSFSEGRRWFGQLLEKAPASGERVGALTVTGKLAVLQGDSEEGLVRLEEARKRLSPSADQQWVADIAHTEGLAALFWGESENAIAMFNEALARHRAAGNDFGVMLALIQLATAKSLLGDAERAMKLCEECLEISQEHDDQWCASMALWTQSLIRWHWGEHGHAEALARETLRIKENFGDRMGMAMAMEVIAWVAETQGHHARAAQLLGAVEAAWRSIGGSSLFRHLAESHAKCAERARDALGTAVFDEAFGKGRALDFDDAVALARGRGARTRAPSPVPRQDTELTTREHEIASLVAKGLSNREIAAQLVISPRTAEKHVEKILTKLGLNSRTQIGVLIATGIAAGNQAAGNHAAGQPATMAMGT